MMDEHVESICEKLDVVCSFSKIYDPPVLMQQISSLYRSINNGTRG